MSFSSKRVLCGLWIALFPALLIVWYFPVTSFSSRIATLIIASLIIVNSLFLSWRRPVLRWVLIGLYILLAAFIFFPAGPGQDRSDLRASYAKALTSYSGCPYVWGGEGRFGIDCSGLVRRGLVDTFIWHGISTRNPYWIRSGISLWWNDTTAQVMGQGYGGRTREITTCRTLNELDPALLQPGDLAVTTSGIHVMAYLGNKKWIGADPGEMRVTIFDIPEETNGWFSSPMRIMRWSLLEEK